MRKKPCWWTPWTGRFSHRYWVFIKSANLHLDHTGFLESLIVPFCINLHFIYITYTYSWPLCFGVHQSEDCRPFLDRPVGRRARTAASHPQRPLSAGFALQATCSGRRLRNYTWFEFEKQSSIILDVYFFQIQKRQSSGSMDDRPLMWVKDYVESLHQNSRATLLFGKNNVLVQPVCVFRVY